MDTRTLILLLVVLIILLLIWVSFNPSKKFGIHVFGFTIYNRIPIPYFDIKIHADGSFSLRGKSHLIQESEIREILNEKPNILVIGTGYSELAQLENIPDLNANIEIINTEEAITRFNYLKEQNKKVAAIIHTTC